MSNESFDHKRLLASLSDTQRVDLTSKSDAKGLSMLASHIIGLVLTGLWIIYAVPGWQLVLWLHGVQIVFLFTLLHETVHDTPFQSTILNRFAGWMSSLLILLPPTWFRYFHLAHHRHTHDPEKDPELDGEQPQTFIRYLWAVSGLPVWWFHMKTIFTNAFGSFEYQYLPKSAHGRIRNEARIMLIVYFTVFAVSFYLASTAIFYLWILPVLIGQPFLRLYLMAEHGRCPHVANMLENSRTTYTTRFVRWLAWNMPYHAEHHAYPAVPFHKLATLHEITKAYIGTLENGYTSFHRDTIAEFSKSRQ